MEQIGNCKICGEELACFTLRLHERMMGSGAEFDYTQCSRCHALALLGAEEIDFRTYYPAGLYYSLLQGRARVSRIGRAFLGPALRANRWVRLVVSIVLVLTSRLKFPYFYHVLGVLRSGARSIAPMLDVGSGSGGFACMLSDLGIRPVVATDPFVTRDELACSSIQFVEGGLENVRSRYSLITFNHSIEHMQDPVHSLRTARRLLRRGGRCVVRTPDLHSYTYRRYGARWVELDAPRHLHVLSRKSMEIAATRAGFRIVRSYTDSSDFEFRVSRRFLLEDGVAVATHEPNLMRVARYRNRRGQGGRRVYVLAPYGEPT